MQWVPVKWASNQKNHHSVFKLWYSWEVPNKMGRQMQGYRKALAPFGCRLTSAFLFKGKYMQPALVDGEFIHKAG